MNLVIPEELQLVLIIEPIGLINLGFISPPLSLSKYFKNLLEKFYVEDSLAVKLNRRFAVKALKRLMKSDVNEY